MMPETMSSVVLRSDDPIDRPRKTVGWEKRSMPTKYSLRTDGGHGANAPLPTLDLAASALPADFLRKRVAPAVRPVEHGLARRPIPVAHEIALPFELHHLVRIIRGDRRLDP